MKNKIKEMEESEREQRRGGEPRSVFSPEETDNPCDYLLSYLLML